MWSFEYAKDKWYIVLNKSDDIVRIYQYYGEATAARAVVLILHKVFWTAHGAAQFN
jgi:hypothetical protein